MIPKIWRLVGFFSITSLLLKIFLFNGNAQVFYAGLQPGNGAIKFSKNKYRVFNNILSVDFEIGNGKIKSVLFNDYSNKKKFVFNPAQLFSLKFKNGNAITANQFQLNESITQNRRKDVKGSYVEINFPFIHKPSQTEVNWSIQLYDSVNYVLQQYAFSSGAVIDKFYALTLPEDYQPVVSGIVDGSPVVCGNSFWAIENPMFVAEKMNVSVSLAIKPFNTNDAGKYEETMVWGCTPANQLRRGFLFYLEHRRPVPYSPYTYYDSWYDLSYGLNVLTEEECIDRVKMWGDSLAKRGTGLNCFLWDSGWDDWYDMWEFNKKLPERFRNINNAARQYKAHSGAWLSPWGGYDEFIVERLATAKKKFPQYKIVGKGFTLTDSLYYNYFEKTVLDLIKYDSAALFKIDGVGAGKDANSAGDHSDEMNLFIKMMKNVRKQKPDVRLNLTVGTWPSPFWLFIGDNIWKGGEDYGVSAEGNKRQQWMNFRDAGVYSCIKRAPLCPVSSLMFHGITVANYGATAAYEMDDAFIADDIWAFLGNGSSLQEFYIDPHKLNSNMWNELAKAIKWSHSKKSILVDSHWIGGDPSKGEVYGFASWNPSGGALMLRNPSSKEMVFNCSLDDLLEIPENYRGGFQLYNVRDGREEKTISSAKVEAVSLKPFEVKVFDIKALQ